MGIEIFDGEIWKHVVGWEDKLLVSNFGRVYSLDNNRIMYQHDNGNGYKIIRINRDFVRKYLRVHRLVAQAFIPNPYNKDMVNHMDLNKSNNRLSNLEWVTHEENIAHYHRNKHTLKHG